MYLPREDLITRLNRTQQLWQTNSNTIIRLSQESNQTLSFKSLSTDQLKQSLLSQLPRQIDEFAGGLNATQKFPNSPLLKALLLEKNLDTNILTWLETTLEAMN